MTEYMQLQLPQAIEHFLRSRNFTLTKSIENGRHILVQGTLPTYGYQIVIKIRSETALKQRNHVLWTKHMQNTIPKDAPFHIAPILEEGAIAESWHWFIMPFIEGEAFATMNRQYISTTLFENDTQMLSRIIALMHHIERTEAQSVVGIDARFGGVSRRDKLKMRENAIDWARGETPYLSQLLQIINKNYEYLGMGNSHGDFTELNLIINAQNEPVLIDAEISYAFNYKFYDIAEFYCRLYTRLCSPELAQRFLRLYVDTLPIRSRRKFFNNFLCLSALRCLGNITEIMGLHEGPGKEQRLTFAKRYAEAIISYNIVSLVD